MLFLLVALSNGASVYPPPLRFAVQHITINMHALVLELKVKVPYSGYAGCQSKSCTFIYN